MTTRQSKTREKTHKSHISDKAVICLVIVFITMGCFRYEQEINKRNDAENEFVLLKKVRKCGNSFEKQFKLGQK